MSKDWSAMAWEKIKRLEAEIAALRAQNQALRVALEEVEWGLMLYDGDQYEYRPYCPDCKSPKGRGKHKDDCLVGNALKLARGE